MVQILIKWFSMLIKKGINVGVKKKDIKAWENFVGKSVNTCSPIKGFDSLCHLWFLFTPLQLNTNKMAFN